MHNLRCTLLSVCANEFDRSIHGLNANIHAADNKVKIQFNDEIIHKVRETTKDLYFIMLAAVISLKISSLHFLQFEIRVPYSLLKLKSENEL